MEEEGQQSLECIQANQIFPRKPPVLEQDDLQVPYAELHGEFTQYVGRAEDAIIAMSSYRLHIKFKESIVNVPLQLIESVESRDMFQLHITCKDCKVVRCQFSTLEQCQEWLKRLVAAIRPPAHLEELFAFAYHAWCVDVYTGEKEQHGQLCRPGDHVTSRFKSEVERMGFDTQNAWRVSHINSKHKLCPSYPQQLLVPAWITDKELENVAAFRSWKRIPAVVYRHQSTGAVIARCGQPEVSWWGWRNADDEHLVQSIAKACAVDSSSSALKPLTHSSCSRDFSNGTDLSDTDFESSMTNSSEVESLAIQPHKLLILDARSYAAAVANRAKGGGCECPEYYPNCEVVFMSMANIHSIRKSFQALRFLCTQMPDPANWLSALENTKWLQHLSLLLKAALLVVNAVDRDQRPVLVHCSDGWDRTPQIAALGKILLDPYYRTVEGFQVLVETEWLDFGHKFADRCGHGENAEDLNERCPVFLQWLDCVHQLQRQFPCSFEFNEAFLVKLVQHTYSCLYGTFLCNSGKEREERLSQEKTCSVWSLLRPANRAFRNMLYSSHSETVLHPVCHVRNLLLWTAVYLPSSLPTTPSDDSCAPYPNPEDQPLGRRSKTRSFDNLPSACEVFPNRRSSDPSLNEKWQDHRRSLELNIGTGAESDQDERPAGQNGTLAGPAGLRTGPVDGVEDESVENMENVMVNGTRTGRLKGEGLNAEEEGPAVSVGVTAGLMENVLQEATEDAVGVVGRLEKANGRGRRAVAHGGDVYPNRTTDAMDSVTNRVTSPEDESREALKPTDAGLNPNDVHTHAVNGALADAPTPEPQGATESQEAPSAPASGTPPPSYRTHAALRTMSNGGAGAGPAEQPDRPDQQPPPESLDKRLSLLESSTETITEEGTNPALRPDSLAPARSDGPEPDATPELSGPSQRPALCALAPVPPAQDDSRPPHPPCNGGESWEPEPGTPQWARSNGERAPPFSRQLSAASCGSLTLQYASAVAAATPPPACPYLPQQHRASCSQHHHHHRCCPHGIMGRPTTAASPSEAGPSQRSHLDEDGLALHTDAVQQRLRQIEAGHQAEVDTLKRQVQELWSRLESQQAAGGLRLNGDLGDELTSIADSDFNLDPNCLSRCSTEFFSEASWEQVDKQDTEVTRWYPDHLAAQCYGCESRFWLATRRHHCRNCGNVFCGSCCDQKIPVPSQQLFEPSRVCKSCFTSLQAAATPKQMELERPITASSN
ncbi:phosphatidylinositol-3,5-bisphosphate 3-phosphatase MTMR3 isoform X1 [Alosa pseudoharengus]|uniref:phosphatidylinositol-3,5-bisphosphate 3-phosphatase MTMR3 isoform X1 n=1 Tax=Alosa pseudoharengus TaxID=34774 RepID=UPI003F8BE95A